jgi:hypothetical protein
MFEQRVDTRAVAVLAADPASAAERDQRARAGRFVSPPCREPDGMASLLIRLPAADAAAIYVAEDAAARRQQKATDSDDKRTLEQVRADVLAELGWSALHAGHLGCCQPTCGHVGMRLGRRRGRPVMVNVTVAFTTLIGVDDQPAHLHGYGPITAEVARRIAADGTWRRLLTDPASRAVLDVGRERYTPPPDLAEHVIVRDKRRNLGSHATPWWLVVLVRISSSFSAGVRNPCRLRGLELSSAAMLSSMPGP